MDKTALKNRVFEQTNIRIDESDPVFALVVMNEVTMQTALAEGVQAMKSTVGEILTDQAIRLNQLRGAAAQMSDNIEAGIAHGTAAALVEVNQAIDKLQEQATQYEEKSAELEKGLNHLVHNFQKSVNEIMIHEVVTMGSDMKAAGASFRQRMVDDQVRALDAISEAKKHQTWGAVWQLGFALAIGLLGGFVGANIHAVQTNDKIANLEHLIIDQRNAK